MNQNHKFVLQQIQIMLSKLSDHIFKANSLILEINNMINQINITYENNQNNFIQMNNNPFNFNMNLNPFFNKLNNESNINQKINVTFNLNNIKTNLTVDNNITINEVLNLYLKKKGIENIIEIDKLGFIYNGETINFNDKRQIKDLNIGKLHIGDIIVYQKDNL